MITKLTLANTYNIVSICY